MHISVDEPQTGATVLFSGFVVVGWLWLDADHEQLAAVEVWTGEFLLAESSALYARADVAQRLGLPTTARTGFFITAALPDGERAAVIALALRARMRDGRRTPVLTRLEIRAAPAEGDPLRTLRASVQADACGLEIGAHAQPVPGLTPYYVDSVAEFAGSAGRVDFLADAQALPLADETLDYLCSSHVLEHLADPLGALHEWCRVLRPHGLLYLVVPDKRFTFDAPRATTTARHVLHDFREGTAPRDSLEHVDEFVEQTDWARLRPDCAPAEKADLQQTLRRRYRELIAQGERIDVHFHTFTPESLRALLRVAGFVGEAQSRFEMVATAERFPAARADGFALLLRKTRRSRPAPAARRGTFSLHRSDVPVPLPLVCPVTLTPLRQLATGTLVSSRGNFRYDIMAGRPNLLPPAAGTVRRRWGTRFARLRGYMTGRVRLARTAEAR